MNEIILPEDASEQEKEIHAFLDDLDLNKISIKDVIESRNSSKSPELKLAIRNQRESLKIHMLGSNSSPIPAFEKSPSILQRRAMYA